MTATIASSVQKSGSAFGDATAPTTIIARPSATCSATIQLRSRPNRSTSGLHRNLNVTARCSSDVDEICVFDARIWVRNSVAIWCRKLQGSPSPK